MRQSIDNSVLVAKGEIEIVKATWEASADVVGAASLGSIIFDRLN